MFACRIHVVLTYKYSIIWVNTNLTCLLNGVRSLNFNMIYLLNGLVMSTRLTNYIKVKKKGINQINLNYEKPKNK